MPKSSSRKRKLDPEMELLSLNKKFKRLERKILSAKRKKRVIVSSSESSSSERSRSASRELDLSPPRVVERRDTRSASSERGRRAATAASPAPACRAASPPAAPDAPAAPPTRAHALQQDDESSDLIIEPTTVPCAAAGPSAVPPQTVEPAEPEFDENILKILGEEPSLVRPLGKDIHKDIATRFEHIATNGLSKETLKELLDQYLIPANCTKIDAPELNPEVKPAVNEIVLKRLKAMESKQKQMAAAIAALGEAISYLLSQQNKDSVLLKFLMDAARIVCDCQYKESLTRRGFILSGVKKEMKEQMKDTKIEKFLFGHNLSETLKVAKAIQRSSADLKPVPAKKPASKNAASSNPLNWKNPPAHRSSAPAGMAGSTRTAPPVAASKPRAASSKSSRSRAATTRSRR